MIRTLAISLVLCTALATPVRADIVLPPISLYVEGQRGELRGAAPDRATFVLRNVSDEAMDVYLFRVNVQEAAMRVPLTIDRVTIGRRTVRQTVRVPARSRVRVTVHFTIPEQYQGRASYTIDLLISNGSFGGWEASPAELTRRADGPEKWITVRSE